MYQFANATKKLNDQEIVIAKEGNEKGTAGNFADRFYRTLYEAILKVQLTKAAKMDEFFGLVFKAMKNDTCVGRVIAFLKRMLQMCFLNEASFTAASLLIFSEIIRVRKDVRLSLFSFGASA